MAAPRRRQVPGLEGWLGSADGAVQHATGDGRHAVDREAELLEDRPGRGARAEMVEPDDRALVSDPAVPTERHTGLDGDAGPDGAWQDGLAIGGILGLEPLPAGEGDDPRRDPVALQGFGRAERELELG